MSSKKTAYLVHTYICVVISLLGWVQTSHASILSRKVFELLCSSYEGFPATFCNARRRIACDPYISGDSFKNVADVCFDETSTLKDVEKILHSDPYQIIFVKGDVINLFLSRVHPHLRAPYILVTHNSAQCVPKKYYKMLGMKKLHHWFGLNCSLNFGHSKFTPLPLGVLNAHWEHSDHSSLSEVIKQAVPKRHLLYMNFTIETYPQERERIWNMFVHEKYVFIASKRNYYDFLMDLKASKFCLSPRGSGLDCHRIWEALLVGCIPIVITSSLDYLLRDLPVMIVKDWKEVTLQSLEDFYRKMNKKSYNLNKLYFKYWKNLILDVKRQALTEGAKA